MDTVIVYELVVGWFGLGFIASLIYLMSPDRRYGYRYFSLLLLALAIALCITILGPLGVALVIYEKRKLLISPEE